MYAQGSKRYDNPAAVAGDNFTVSDQRANLSRHRLWINKDGTQFRPRQQPAIRRVLPVGEGFSDEGMARCPRRLFHG